jgi:YD repeat-containing protein
MKTIKFIILALLVMVVLVGRAQTLTEPGWYKAVTARPLPSGSPGLATSQSATINGSEAFSPFSVPNAPVIAEAVTPEIQALARGLENDPTRIFDYVHDHIRHVLYYGSKKGAQLTLLERSGNDFDQCALLVALLQAAGYTNNPGYDRGVGYQFGVLKMPYDSVDHNDVHHWLQLSLINTNWANTTNFISGLLAHRGYPIDPVPLWFDEGDNNTIAFQRIWVTLTIGAITYYLDPAFKISEPITGINLAAAMQFSSNSVMTAAGGTNTTDYVKNLNEALLRSTLQGYNSNLLAAIQSNYPNASVQQILGGQQIIPWTNSLSQLRMFPVDTRGKVYPILNWTNEPTAFMSTFGISFWGVNQQWYFPQLQGGRLSLTFNSNGVAQLWLEDTLIASQTNTSGSSMVSVTLTANHPYFGWDTNNNVPYSTGGPPFGYDLSIANTYRCTNASYGIIYAFEPDLKWLNEREQALDTYRQKGFADTSRQVLTESLNIMGLNWMIQTKLNEDILDQQMGILPQWHERLGRMAQEIGRGYYVDVYFELSALHPNSGANPQDVQNMDRAFDLNTYIASAMEHGLIQQLQTNGLVAASTVKILELASTNKQTIYLANSNNWTSGANVRSHLVNYDLTDPFPQGLDSLISRGYSLLLPTNGSVQIAGAGSWAGYGFVEQQVTTGSEVIGMLIGGGYSGGFVSAPSATVWTYTPFISSVIGYTVPTYAVPTPISTTIAVSADPVNMADATFRLNYPDLSVGQTEPLGMMLSRYYTPTRQHLNLANMANGWVNSYYFNLSEVSAPKASLGGTTPAQMAPMLVTTCAALNLYNPQPDPKNWLVTVLIAKWGIDQIISNAVSIALGNETLEFIRQPGGIFTPPANCTWTLTNLGTYKLQERHGNAFIFNSSKQLTSITNQSGDTLSLTYTSGKLTKATDWKSRTLTFTYSGTPSRLASVADNSGRTVTYGYTTSADGNLDLTSVTDPEGKTSTFAYDTNHQIIATYDALGRLVVTNIYDSFGHVITQYTQGDTNKTWQIYWSGWETVSQDPAGSKQRYYYDDQTRLIAQQDPLGNISQTMYDGQNHTVMTISPLNETNQTIYDGNNNVVQTIDSMNFTNRFVYDNQNNLVQTIDARDNISKFGYDSKFRLTGSTNGTGDWVAYTYNADGTLAKRIDPGGTNTYAYDANGILSSITYPGGLGSESFANNPLGDVTSHTSSRGFVTTFQYNNRRQLTNTIAPTNMITRVAYDAIGNVVSATDARGFTSSNAWSVTRHLLVTTLPPTPAGTATITNAYDNRDWLVRTVNPMGQATLYTNDAAQRLVATTDPLLRTTTLGYDADGQTLLPRMRRAMGRRNSMMRAVH